MLEIFRGQEEEKLSNGLLQSTLNEGWIPGQASRGDWNRKDDSKDQLQNNPDVCWTFDNSTQPLALIGMNDGEKELFTTSVNSPLKGPTQVNKDGPILNGRKTSISQGQGIPTNVKSDRPGPRRRGTSDSIGGGLGTPTFNRRDETNPMTSPSSLLRRRTDLKDSIPTIPLDKSSRLESGIDTTTQFNSWKRNASGPMSAGVTGPSSPWASAGPPQSAGFGTFGNFSYEGTSTTPATPGEKRIGYGSSRGESRLKGLMGKESLEDIGGKSTDKSILGLGKLTETQHDKHVESGPQTFEEDRIGSAALLDDHDSPSNVPGPEKKQLDDIGFANFGTPSQLNTGRVPHNSFLLQENEIMSPTGTNPYQSPEGEDRHGGRVPEDDLGSLGSFSSRMQARQQAIGSFDGAGDRDRFQSSSSGPTRNFPAVSGLGNLTGNSPWPTTSTPGGFGQARTNQPFGSGIFSSMADIPSTGGSFGGSNNSPFSSTRSKMGSLFPEHNREGSTETGDTFSARGVSASHFPHTSTEYQQGVSARNVLDDLFRTPGSNENHRDLNHNMNLPGSYENQRDFNHNMNPPGTRMSSSSGPSSQYGFSPEPNQPPPAQQRQMVMPDRIRWIYRDPSGNMQGPFNGLEMHDWYKAGFFSPELQVKKAEERDYEPLAQLIRRIGNSREPFLVPQIGIPHGPPSAALGTPAGNATLGIQPPFGNSFPSFGTTLTADQQNALERRKQEEQILMARQKEHLQQQQSLMRTMIPGVPFNTTHQSLHHQASGQSLHSHPSFGNIGVSGGFHHQATGNVFDRQSQPPDVAFAAREAGIHAGNDRVIIGHLTQAQNGYPDNNSHEFNHSQQVSNMLQDRARLQAQQDQWNAMSKDEAGQSMDRLDQFHQLRIGDHDQVRHSSGPIAPPRAQTASPVQPEFEGPAEIQGENPIAQQQNFQNMVQQSSQSHMLPPSTQRRRQPAAEALVSEIQDHFRTELPETPSLAPWAKESQNSKAPSLLEIQEAESRKAARQEELVAAARRQFAERERVQASQAAAQAAAQAQVAGLPSTANWASNSPASATPTSPWAKPATTGTPTNTGKTKTLAQIQREEESRKQRATASAAAAAAALSSITAPVATPGGKSYANLVGKVAAPANVAAGTGWNVVGSSGKAKTPTSPVVSSTARVVSSGAAASITKAKPQLARSSTSITTAQIAQDAFQKWVKNSLVSGLNNSINVEDFVKNLISYPLEEDLISDAIYGNSQTLDGRRFAREFIQRKKDVEKGKVHDSTASNFVMGGTDAKGTSGGWNEVAKKAPAPAREDPATNFKVVAAKKRGGKR